MVTSMKTSQKVGHKSEEGFQKTRPSKLIHHQSIGLGLGPGYPFLPSVAICMVMLLILLHNQRPVCTVLLQKVGWLKVSNRKYRELSDWNMLGNWGDSRPVLLVFRIEDE